MGVCLLENKVFVTNWIVKTTVTLDTFIMLD